MTLSTKLSWSDIKTLYPHQNVALTDVEYVDGTNVVKNAKVACTDKDTDLNEMRYNAIKGKYIVKYTTLDEDSIYDM